MKELPEAKIEEILQGNAESLNTEFKSTFDVSTNTWAKERLIRSMLAMSNTRDGGYIVVGISEKKDKSLDYTGIEETHLSTFKTKAEEFKTKVESFSSSPVIYEIGVGPYKGKNYLVISVNEFVLNPLICRRNGENGESVAKHLEEGAIYIRTLKDKPSSVKLTNPIDIQDFLERASDKQISNLHKRGWKHDTENLKNSESSFKKERGSF